MKIKTKKRLFKNVFLTNLGIGVQVNSPRKAMILNAVLLSVFVVAFSTILFFIL